MNIGEHGVTEEMLPGLVQSTLVMEGGYKVLTRGKNGGIGRKSVAVRISINPGLILF